MLKMLSLCGALVLLFTISGCGSADIGRIPVSGSVTLDGQPLEEGSILFTPLGDGPTVGGEIQNGRYTLDQQTGPSAGRYRVQINAWRPAGKAVVDAATGQSDETLVSIVPPRYNDKSELEVTIEQGAASTHDFALESK